MASERPPIAPDFDLSIRDPRMAEAELTYKWYNYALDLEKRARALCDKIREGGHADADDITGSHNCQTCCAIDALGEALREILPKEVPDEGKTKG